MPINPLRRIRVPAAEHTPPYESFLDSRGFRPEIQGLRAFAVLLVVLYHVWIGKVSGGVDVFLFISAFLLSLSFMRKINEGKALNLLAYWTHVFARLLPAAAVMIVLTLAASLAILPALYWNARAVDAQASLFYYQNWNLANGAVNYFAQGISDKSPFQHFWSLSIQGQIFLLWPILFAVAAFLVHRVRFKPVPAAVTVFGTVFMTSFAFSIWETKQISAYAYFDTRTRLWEFAIGTLLAVMTLKWKPRHVRTRVVMGWAGALGLVTCGAVLPVERTFPGYLALWPVLSGALVMIAGRTDHKFAIDRLLVSTPLQSLGNISYALYLVHWPLLVLYSAAVNKPRVNFLEGTVIIAFSIGLAWVLSTYIEKPLRSRSGVFLDKTVSKLRVTTIFTPTLWVNQLAYVLVILLVIGAPVLSVRAWAQQRDITVIQNTEELVKNDEATYPGARAVGTDQMSRVSKPIPQDIPIYGMLADWGEGCPAPFTPMHESLNTSCAVKQNGDDSAPLTIVVGSSHALQMTAAFEPIAQRTGTNQMNLLETGCPYPFAAPEGYLNDRKKRCIAFSQKATEEILRLKPTTVVIIATTTDTSADAETADPNLDETLRVFTDAGIQVIGLRDNPRFAQDMYVCAIRAQGDKSSCSEPIEQKYGDNPAAPIFEKYADRGAYLIDLKDIYCPDGLCRSVIGNVYVYADTNHLTKAFEHTLAETIYERALAAGWKPEGYPGS